MDAASAQGESSELAAYAKAWEALGQMLTAGQTFSGHERDCCFLNTHGGRFADVSAVMGLDDDGDGRAAAFVDWDLDGDLDIWTVSRTAPMVRVWQNQLPGRENFLAIQLQGTTCNRDAIGARAHVRGSGIESPLERTIRAGEGFLAQGSKWLHFGLGNASGPFHVEVHWPGGPSETFTGLQANGRYRLVQGSGRARSLTIEKRPMALVAAEQRLHPLSSEARVLLPARLPLPELKYTDHDGGEHEISPLGTEGSSPILINLWASWCQPCLKELRELGSDAALLDGSGLRILPLRVEMSGGDEDEEEVDARALLRQLGVPWEGGVAPTLLVERLDMIQRLVTSLQRPLPVPFSFLLDEHGHLAVVYRGRVSVDQLLEDVALLDTPREQVRDLAIPMPGTWYTSPFPPDVLVIPQRFMESGDHTEAYRYLQRHLSSPEVAQRALGTFPPMVASQIAIMHNRVAEFHVARQLGDQALECMRAAVAWEPSSTQFRERLAAILLAAGEAEEAAEHFAVVATLDPKNVLAQNNAAWLMATAADVSPDRARRALELAKEACGLTEFRQPSILSTLAAAQAANGDFDAAQATIGQAIQLAQSANQPTLVARLKERQASLAAKRRIVEPFSTKRHAP